MSSQDDSSDIGPYSEDAMPVGAITQVFQMTQMNKETVNKETFSYHASF